MALGEAKDYLIKSANPDIEAHDLVIDALGRTLVEAADKRRQASDLLRGSRVQYFAGSFSQLQDAPATSILYDAAWELVREGLLRPGPRFTGVLNQSPSGFCLTAAGQKRKDS
jgi:hypothetical protein